MLRARYHTDTNILYETKYAGAAISHVVDFIDIRNEEHK